MPLEHISDSVSDAVVSDVLVVTDVLASVVVSVVVSVVAANMESDADVVASNMDSGADSDVVSDVVVSDVDSDVVSDVVVSDVVVSDVVASDVDTVSGSAAGSAKGKRARASSEKRRGADNRIGGKWGRAGLARSAVVLVVYCGRRLVWVQQKTTDNAADTLCRNSLSRRPAFFVC